MTGHPHDADSSLFSRLLTPLVSVLTLLMGAGISCSVAHAQEALSTNQMESLEPKQANRVVRDDLLSVLEPVSGIGRGNLLRLRAVTIDTRPYGTAFDGLCRRDTLWLMYAPVDLHAPTADQPLQPYGINSTSEFHATKLPLPRSDDLAMREDVWSKGCDRLSADKATRWFEAKNSDEAARALHALVTAKDLIGAGQIKPAKCQLFSNEKRSCIELALDTSVEKIDLVESCASKEGQVCYEIYVSADTRLRITVQPAAEGLSPKVVDSIEVEQYLIVT